MALHRTRSRNGPSARVLIAAACCFFALAGAATAFPGDEPSPAAPDDPPPYGLALRALTGPKGADLTVRVTHSGDAAPITVLKHVQLKIYTLDGVLAATRNLSDVPAAGGTRDLALGHVGRGRRVDADVLVQPGDPPRTYVLRQATATKLRPDVVVAAVQAPPQTLTTEPIAVEATLEEVNGDTDATTDATLMWGVEPLAVKHDITVAAGKTTTVTFPDVTLARPVAAELTVVISDVAPYQTDESNDTGTASVEVTKSELTTPRHVLFPSLIGYGAQIGNHLYAPISPWPAGADYADVEQKVKLLEPQLVRIFYNDNWDGNWTTGFWTPTWQENYASFVKSVQLAQEAGATIDISFQNLGNAKAPSATSASMARFADVLEELVRDYGLTNVQWAEVGNEPNTPCSRPVAQGGCPDPSQITIEQYAALTRALHTELVARGLHDQIHLMGGGLIESAGLRHHYQWLPWIAANMGDVVDAYAEHIYWWYDRPGRLEYRLRDTANLMNDVLPVEQRKPQYMMEFGVRGYSTCVGKPDLPSANQSYYRDGSCSDIWRTNIAAFQQLWFNIASAQLGVAGTSKWDAYWSMYDRSSPNNQFYWMVGPPTEGSPLTPTYNAMSLLFHTTVPGWQILRVGPWEANDWTAPNFGGTGGESSDDQREQELVGYAGPSGELTIMGIDTNGRDLNTVSTDSPSGYSIGGLPASTTFTLAIWNATGDGTNSIARTMTTDEAGVVRFEVPLHAAFALTTVPVS